jgi:hypothetical protein
MSLQRMDNDLQDVPKISAYVPNFEVSKLLMC